MDQWHNDREPDAVMASSIDPMSSSIRQLITLIERFEQWFNAHFGWFFTNGMKVGTEKTGNRVKASSTRSSLR
jgi:hypothetical protein